ncbi:hypothetical protein B7R77_00770 [Ralstonia solanacearum K60]|uniref:Uncharacterized protein n=2 Tax=Ralstonia TaxID=48736 RepID=A0AAP7ZK83_RALSL|nr:hypothetical protein B7R77_00770 [Ralstonia solanacearum K60]CCF96043.1 conserved exported hypothetical protein [Ralstonia solanacearum K60]
MAFQTIGIDMKFSHFKRNTTFVCAATALLLMAAFPASNAIAKTVGSETFATPFNGSPTRANAWKAAWGAAWNLCRAQYPTTRSVNMTAYRYSAQNPQAPNFYTIQTTWECRDTP